MKDLLFTLLRPLQIKKDCLLCQLVFDRIFQVEVVIKLGKILQQGYDGKFFE